GTRCGMRTWKPPAFVASRFPLSAMYRSTARFGWTPPMDEGSQPLTFPRLPAPLHRLLEHLVRQDQERRGNREAEGLGGLEIDRALELHRPQNRPVGRLGPLEDLAGVEARLAIRLDQAGCVAHQAPGHDELAKGVDRGHGMARCQCHEVFAPAVE